MTATNQVEALRTEAGEHGDLNQVAVCDRALAGDEDAIAECQRVIASASASAWIEMDDRTSYRVEDAAVFVSSSDEVTAEDSQLIADSLGHRLGGRFKPSFDWTPAEEGTSVAWFYRA